MEVKIVGAISRLGTALISNQLPLKAGDLIHAKLLQIENNGRAVIVINGEKMEVKLLSPLEAGKSYLFQIQLANSEILLKHVQTTTGNEETIKATLISQLTRQFGIQKDSWEHRLINLAVHDEWLELGSNKLRTALEWLGQSSMKKQDFQIIEFMSRANLPFSKTIFQSLSALYSGKDVSTLLQTLSISPQHETIQNLMRPLETKIGYRIAELAFSSLTKYHEMAKQLLNQFQQLLMGSDPQSGKLLVEINATEARLLQTGSNIPLTLEKIENMLKHEMKLQSDTPILSGLGKYALSVISNSREQQIHQFQTIEEDFLQLIRTEIASEIKKGIKALGINFEAELAGQRSEGLESLKSILLQFQEQGKSAQKQSVQELISHLHGQKLISSDIGNMIHLLIKLPLPLLHQLKDAEISWSGNKTKNGKIDSSHCRILFHLHLEKLGETILDLQVQNRISSLHVFHTIENFEAPSGEIIDAFKLGMKQLGFHVSSIQFQNVSEEEKNKLTPLYQLLQPKSKVDIRI